jgi:hypothetical protein
MPRPIHIAVLTLAAAIAACAQDAPRLTASGQPRACFLARDVADWEKGRPGQLNLRTTRGEYYQAAVFPSCPEIDTSQQLAIVTRFADRVCEGHDATLIVPTSLGRRPDRCRIDRVRRLTAEEVAALPPGEKP